MNRTGWVESTSYNRTSFERVIDSHILCVIGPWSYYDNEYFWFILNPRFDVIAHGRAPSILSGQQQAERSFRKSH